MAIFTNHQLNVLNRHLQRNVMIPESQINNYYVNAVVITNNRFEKEINLINSDICISVPTISGNANPDFYIIGIDVSSKYEGDCLPTTLEEDYITGTDYPDWVFMSDNNTINSVNNNRGRLSWSINGCIISPVNTTMFYHRHRDIIYLAVLRNELESIINTEISKSNIINIKNTINYKTYQTNFTFVGANVQQNSIVNQSDLVLENNREYYFCDVGVKKLIESEDRTLSFNEYSPLTNNTTSIKYVSLLQNSFQSALNYDVIPINLSKSVNGFYYNNELYRLIYLPKQYTNNGTNVVSLNDIEFNIGINNKLDYLVKDIDVILKPNTIRVTHNAFAIREKDLKNVINEFEQNIFLYVLLHRSAFEWTNDDGSLKYHRQVINTKEHLNVLYEKFDDSYIENALIKNGTLDETIQEKFLPLWQAENLIDSKYIKSLDENRIVREYQEAEILDIIGIYESLNYIRKTLFKPFHIEQDEFDTYYHFNVHNKEELNDLLTQNNSLFYFDGNIDNTSRSHLVVDDIYSISFPNNTIQNNDSVFLELNLDGVYREPINTDSEIENTRVVRRLREFDVTNSNEHTVSVSSSTISVTPDSSSTNIVAVDNLVIDDYESPNIPLFSKLSFDINPTIVSSPFPEVSIDIFSDRADVEGSIFRTIPFGVIDTNTTKTIELSIDDINSLPVGLGGFRFNVLTYENSINISNIEFITYGLDYNVLATPIGVNNIDVQRQNILNGTNGNLLVTNNPENNSFIVTGTDETTISSQIYVTFDIDNFDMFDDNAYVIPILTVTNNTNIPITSAILRDFILMDLRDITDTTSDFNLFYNVFNEFIIRVEIGDTDSFRLLSNSNNNLLTIGELRSVNALRFVFRQNFVGSYEIKIEFQLYQNITPIPTRTLIPAMSNSILENIGSSIVVTDPPFEFSPEEVVDNYLNNTIRIDFNLNVSSDIVTEIPFSLELQLTDINGLTSNINLNLTTSPSNRSIDVSRSLQLVLVPISQISMSIDNTSGNVIDSIEISDVSLTYNVATPLVIPIKLNPNLSNQYLRGSRELIVTNSNTKELTHFFDYSSDYISNTIYDFYFNNQNNIRIINYGEDYTHRLESINIVKEELPLLYSNVTPSNDQLVNLTSNQQLAEYNNTFIESKDEIIASPFKEYLLVVNGDVTNIDLFSTIEENYKGKPYKLLSINDDQLENLDISSLAFQTSQEDELTNYQTNISNIRRVFLNNNTNVNYEILEEDKLDVIPPVFHKIYNDNYNSLLFDGNNNILQQLNNGISGDSPYSITPASYIPLLEGDVALNNFISPLINDNLFSEQLAKAFKNYVNFVSYKSILESNNDFQQIENEDVVNLGFEFDSSFNKFKTARFNNPPQEGDNIFSSGGGGETPSNTTSNTDDFLSYDLISVGGNGISRITVNGVEDLADINTIDGITSVEFIVTETAPASSSGDPGVTIQMEFKEPFVISSTNNVFSFIFETDDNITNPVTNISLLFTTTSLTPLVSDFFQISNPEPGRVSAIFSSLSYGEEVFRLVIGISFDTDITTTRTIKNLYIGGSVYVDPPSEPVESGPSLSTDRNGEIPIIPLQGPSYIVSYRNRMIDTLGSIIGFYINTIRDNNGEELLLEILNLESSNDINLGYIFSIDNNPISVLANDLKADNNYLDENNMSHDAIVTVDKEAVLNKAYNNLSSLIPIYIKLLNE